MTLDQELINLLKEEFQILQNMERLTFEKTNLIVENKVEDLESIIKKEEDLINSLALKEKEREKILDNWGLKKDMTISELIENLPQGQKELEKIQEDLLLVLSKIQERNKLNEELIIDNLNWLDFNMNLIYNTQTPPTYGEEESPRGNSLFDRKV